MELQCPQCEKRLRVPDTAAGKSVRCPACQEVISLSGMGQEVPMSGPRAPAPRAMASQTWTVKTEDGQEYGPITKAELDSWVAQGRLGPECQLLVTGGTQWQWADSVYPQLGAAGAAAPPVRAAGPAPAAPQFESKPSPFAVSDNPYASPQSGAGQYGSPGSSSLRGRRILVGDTCPHSQSSQTAGRQPGLERSRPKSPRRISTRWAT